MSNEQIYFDVLKKIARDYQSSDELRRNAGRDYGLPFEEALEMAYENIQAEAERAIKGKEATGMITLHDGPAAGSYAVKRAPLYLRAVTPVEGAKDVASDVLDQWEDKPSELERVSVYLRSGDAGTVHINRGGKGSGFFATGQYYHLADVDGEQLRDFGAWREWVLSQVDADPDTGVVRS